jgi:hypothetical protein
MERLLPHEFHGPSLDLQEPISGERFRRDGLVGSERLTVRENVG